MSLNPKITDQGSKLLLSWTPDPTAEGYRYYKDGVVVSRTFDPTVNSTHFSDDGLSHTYGVACLDVTERPAENVTWPTPPTPSPSTNATGWGKSYSGSSKPVAADDVYDQVMAQAGVVAGDYGPCPAFTHAHLLSYKNASSCYQVDNEWNTGIPHSVALANGWLLKDANGVLLYNKGYSTNNILDVGNVAAQQAWAKNVGDFLQAAGAKGVFIDDVCADYMMVANAQTPKYTQKQWEDAIVAFIAYVGTTLKARGFEVVPNAGSYISGDPGTDNGALTSAFWQRLGPYCTHLFTEYFHSLHGLSMGSGWNQHWDLWQALVPLAQSLGCHFVGGAASNANFVFGSFLLDWDGLFGGNVWGAPQIDVGIPQSPKAVVGLCWKRVYSKKTVYVNPTTSTQTADGHSIPATSALFV